MEINLNFEGFEGSVTMKVAKNSQRMMMMGSLGLNINDLTSKSIEESFSSFETIGKLIEKSEPFFMKVDLKNDKRKYKSFDDLEADMACQSVLIECATKAIMGLGDSGKKSKS
jgi:hypothetical protein